jgi:hypothetical protein
MHRQALKRTIARFISRSSATAWLLWCEIITCCLFYWNFTLRYSLVAHLNKPFQTFATLSHFAPEGAWLYILTFAVAFALYALSYRFGARRLRRRRAIWLILSLSALAHATLMPMYPLDATDVYDYIIRARMTAIYGMNPLRDVPRQLPDDPFYRFVGWKNVPSAYGGAWEIIAALVTRLAGDDVLGNVIAFKCLAALSNLIGALGIYSALLRLAPSRALSGTYLFALNPLLIYMAAGRAHNDALMIACMAWSLAFLARHQHVASLLSLLFGALIKFIPLILIPAVLIVAWHNLQAQARLRAFIVSAFLGAVLTISAYAPFWFGLETLRAERRAQMYSGSLPTVIRQLIAPILDGKSAETWLIPTPNTNALLANSTLALFAFSYLASLWRLWRAKGAILSAVHAMLYVLFAYLLIAALWFMAWYALWLLPFAALLERSAARRNALWFTYLVTWQGLLYNYVTLRPGALAPIPWRDLLPVASYMLPIWLLIGSAAWRGAKASRSAAELMARPRAIQAE